MNSLKTKFENAKKKFSKIEQVQIEYWDMDIWRIN